MSAPRQYLCRSSCQNCTTLKHVNALGLSFLRLIQLEVSLPLFSLPTFVGVAAEPLNQVEVIKWKALNCHPHDDIQRYLIVVISRFGYDDLRTRVRNLPVATSPVCLATISKRLRKLT